MVSILYFIVIIGLQASISVVAPWISPSEMSVQCFWKMFTMPLLGNVCSCLCSWSGFVPVPGGNFQNFQIFPNQQEHTG